MLRWRLYTPVVMLSAAFLASGCGRPGDAADDEAGDAPGEASEATEEVAAPRVFSGRITLADGSRITLPGVRYTITINGVTAVGENNAFAPPVRPDGSFSLRLPQGQFYPPRGTITVPFDGQNYVVPLDPVNPVTTTRSSAPGIVQNFVWRLTGAQPSALNPDPANATHWYGISIPILRSVYREDNKQVQQPPPEGTKVTWTLTPTSKRMDGGVVAPLTRVRATGPNASVSDQLHDLPPANYQVSGVATFPDGSSRRILVLGTPSGNYGPTAVMNLQPYANSGEIITTRIYWVLE